MRIAAFRLLFLFAFALALASSGCKSCKHDEAATTADAAAPVAEPPVPAPDALVAEAYVATPDALWTHLQRSVGGPAAILPATFAGVVDALAGLDPTVAFDVDGARPAYAVVADPSHGEREPAFAIAMRLVDARRTTDALVQADAAKYSGKRVAPGLLALAAKGGAPLALGVAIAESGWLVVASSADDLVRLGPYAYRTLPTKPPPAPEPLVVVAPHAALAGPIRTLLASSWNAKKKELLASADALRDAHDGGAPDFADPPAILAVLDAALQRRLTLLGDLEEARLVVDVADDDVRAELTAKPMPGEGPAMQALAALAPGDVKPLLAVPDTALVAVMMRDPPDVRAGDADDLASSLERALGARLTPDDAKKLHDALGGWARARGDWMTASFTARSPAVVLRAPLAAGDGAAKRATSSVHALLELAGRPAFLAPLTAALHVRGVEFATVDVPGGGHAELAELARRAPPRAPRGAAPPPLAIAWRTEGDEVDVVATDRESAVATLAAAPHPSATLGDDPAAARLLGGLESNATFALVVQPLRAEGSAPSTASAPPIVVAWGRKEGEVWARADVAPALLRELLRLFAGL